MSELLPLFIPSYNRPDAPLIGLANQLLRDQYPWGVFVRKSQKHDYLRNVPENHLIVVDDHLIPTLGDTRNFIMEFALEHHYNRIFDWDDDVFRIGRKLPDGTRHESYTSTKSNPAWLTDATYWHELSRISNEVFDLYPGTVAGSVQNQRWASSHTLQVNCGKTPRRTKILDVARLTENGLWCPDEFLFHGEDIGNTAMYLENRWQIFTVCNLVYDFVPETDLNLPSTLRDRDEDKNKSIHLEEFENLQNYEIKDYLRINKSYEDGSYMYGDIDWRKFRKITGEQSITHEYTNILDRIPLQDIPFTAK